MFIIFLSKTILIYLVHISVINGKRDKRVTWKRNFKLARLTVLLKLNVYTKYLSLAISFMLLLPYDISKRESNKNMFLILLKNMFAYLWGAIAEEYSHDHLFYLFETTVLNFFKTCNKVPRNNLSTDEVSHLLTQNDFLRMEQVHLPRKYPLDTVAQNVAPPLVPESRTTIKKDDWLSCHANLFVEDTFLSTILLYHLIFFRPDFEMPNLKRSNNQETAIERSYIKIDLCFKRKVLIYIFRIY